MARVILVRHGQASFGAADYDRLSATGVAQAEHLGRVLAGRGEAIDMLWSGAMLRHLQTADGLLRGGGYALPLRSVAGFDEFDHRQVIERYQPRYAEYSAMQADLATAPDPLRAFAQMFRAALGRWTGGTCDADYDESWPAFKARCGAALAAVLAQGEAGQTHLVVTSGGVISALVQPLLGLDDGGAMRINWTLANAGLSCIQRSGRGTPTLLSLNEHSHFRGDHQHLLTWR